MQHLNVHKEGLYKHRETMSQQDVLKEVFGHEEFRPGQEEAIKAIREENDCIIVIPTGGLLYTLFLLNESWYISCHFTVGHAHV